MSSEQAGWRGFEFQEIAVPEHGTFEAQANTLVRIMLTFGPMKVRYGDGRRPFQKLPPEPRLTMPGELRRGAWWGAQRGMHLFLEPQAIERMTRRAFRSSDFAAIEGPSLAVQHLLLALRADVQNRHPAGAMFGESLVVGLIHQLLGNEPAPFGPERTVLSPHRFRRIDDWIEANLDRSFSLEELAAETDVSLRQLHRAFVVTAGVSPYRYILGRRVERAKGLIRAGRLSLSEVAAATGFCDQAHMANTFKKLVGIAPLQFRNK